MNTRLGYGEYMKKSLKLDRLEKEERNLRALINSLGNTEPYASHNSTGIVYDKTVLNNRLNNILVEIKVLIRELNNKGDDEDDYYIGSCAQE